MPTKHVLKIKHPVGTWFTGYPIFPSNPNEVLLFPVNIENNTIIPQFKSVKDFIILNRNQPMCCYSGVSDSNNNPLFADDLILIDDMFAVLRFGKHKDCHGTQMVGFFVEWISDASRPMSAYYRNDFCYWTESGSEIKFVKSTHDINNLKHYIEEYRK